MRPDTESDELSPGRLFIHGQLNDPMTRDRDGEWLIEGR